MKNPENLIGHENETASIFMDSGAFSIKSYGLPPTDVYEYIDAIKELQPALTFYANLDVIGDAAAGWENQRIMEKAGLMPIPIFHPAHDPIKYLDRCLEYEYFATGGIAQNPSMNTRIRLLDDLWQYITDDDGFPKSKVHGLGLAAPQLMVRYPWASIDTSSYMDYGQYGIILIPKIRNGKYIYTKPPVKLFVSARSPKNKIDGAHFTTLSKLEQDAVLTYLKHHDVEYGTSEFKTVEKGYKPENGVEVFANNERTIVERPIIQGVSNTNYYRDLINAMYYMDVAESAPEYPWAWPHKQKNPSALF